jgi:hypothetical protein
MTLSNHFSGPRSRPNKAASWRLAFVSRLAIRTSNQILYRGRGADATAKNVLTVAQIVNPRDLKQSDVKHEGRSRMSGPLVFEDLRRIVLRGWLQIALSLLVCFLGFGLCVGIWIELLNRLPKAD